MQTTQAGSDCSATVCVPCPPVTHASHAAQGRGAGLSGLLLVSKYWGAPVRTGLPVVRAAEGPVPAVLRPVSLPAARQAFQLWLHTVACKASVCKCDWPTSLLNTLQSSPGGSYSSAGVQGSPPPWLPGLLPSYSPPGFVPCLCGHHAVSGLHP